MSNSGIKKLFKERSLIEEDSLDELGIYIKFDDSNIQGVRVMIMGPTDTPYEGCFLFIHLVFGDNYPFAPPKATFMNQYKNVRFHPNLYSEGKVCLSILGTWPGPGWTAMMNIKTIVTSIQSLLSEYPIRQEPSYENIEATNPKCINYNIIVGWYVLELAILKVLQTPLPGFEDFNDIMIKKFIENHTKYSKQIDNYKQYDGQTITSVYNMSQTINVGKLRKAFDILSDTYLPK